eukprot:364524-Chlamydomonas_euryale.AAC.2
MLGATPPNVAAWAFNVLLPLLRGSMTQPPRKEISRGGEKGGERHGKAATGTNQQGRGGEGRNPRGEISRGEGRAAAWQGSHRKKSAGEGRGEIYGEKSAGEGRGKSTGTSQQGRGEGSGMARLPKKEISRGGKRGERSGMARPPQTQTT